MPVRLAIGPRDLENETYEVARRDTFEKETVAATDVIAKIEFLMEDIQRNIHQKTLDHRKENITEVDTYEEFKEVLENKGGFISVHWDGTTETEDKIKEETKATIRCIPIDVKEEKGVDIISGKPSKRRVLFAKAY